VRVFSSVPGISFLDTLAHQYQRTAHDMMKRLLIAFAALGSVFAVLVGQQTTPQTQVSPPLAQQVLTTTARNAPTQR
jgi:uncharacterized membrane protein affecting hemolysin expression